MMHHFGAIIANNHDYSSTGAVGVDGEDTVRSLSLSPT